MSVAIAALTLLFISHVSQSPGPPQPATAITQISKSGLCDVNIANVSGPVEVHCAGIPDRALQPLVEQLRGALQENRDLQAEANRWQQQYLKLKDQLADIGLDAQLKVQAKSALDDGDLLRAGELLDTLLEQQDGEVDNIALTHLARASLYDLQFKHSDAMEQMKTAYRLAPDDMRIALAYGADLTNTGQYSEAANVLSAARSVIERTPSPHHDEWLAAVLTNIGMNFASEGKLLEAQEPIREAVELFSTRKDQSVEALIECINAIRFLAEVFYFGGRTDEAKANIDQALDLTKKIEADDSEEATGARAITFETAAAIEAARNNRVAARTLSSQAITAWRRLNSKKPEAYTYKAYLGAGEIRAGLMLKSFGDISGALDLCSRGVAVLELDSYFNKRTASIFIDGEMALGMMAGADHHYSFALDYFRQAANVADQMMRLPNGWEFRHDRVAALSYFAIAAAHLGINSDARTASNEAIGLARGTVSDATATRQQADKDLQLAEFYANGVERILNAGVFALPEPLFFKPEDATENVSHAGGY
jgi:tetratricopeptide (TPR) repeat protein